MFRIIRRSGPVLSSALILFLAGASSAGAADSELWLIFEASGELGNGITASISDEMDFYDDMSDYSVNEIDLGIEYSALNFLNIGFTWDEEFDKQDNTSGQTGDADDWVSTQSAFLDLTWYMEPEGWHLEDRTRFVYAMPDEDKDYFRFRNRMKAKAPWKITKLSVQPWTAWEFYWDAKGNLSGSKRFDKHRLYGGITVSFIEHLGADIYYCAEFKNETGENWYNINILGITFSAHF